MRILLLTQYYTPEPAFKFADLARGLVARGHEVQVITGFPCYPHGKTYDGYQQAIYREETIDGVMVTRIPQIPDHSKSVIRRTLYYLSFALSAATIGLWRSRPADVILAYQSAMPVGLAAWWLSKVKRTPYLLDVVDLWPESLAASGMITNHRALEIVTRIMTFIYKGARRINVITEGYRKNLMAMGVPAKKLSVIHCWPAAGQFDPLPVNEPLAEQYGLRDRFNILYAGAMGAFQGLETVIEAAERLQHLRDIQFVMVGDGLAHQTLVDLAKKKGLNNVLFLGRLAPDVLQRLYPSADALLVHLTTNSMSRVSIPSKVFAYMSSGRPLLVGCEGDASELVQRHKCGVCFTPSNPDALAESVLQLRSMPKERLAMARNARSSFQQYYESNIQTDRFVDILRETAEEVPSQSRMAA